MKPLIGDVALREFRVEHAEKVIAALRKGRSPSTLRPAPQIPNDHFAESKGFEPLVAFTTPDFESRWGSRGDAIRRGVPRNAAAVERDAPTGNVGTAFEACGTAPIHDRVVAAAALGFLDVGDVGDVDAAKTMLRQWLAATTACQPSAGSGEGKGRSP
jgi:hypothetical protein